MKGIYPLLIGKALRAWSGSVVTCALMLLAVWDVMMHQLRNTQNISSMPTERFEHAGEAALITAGVAFVIAASFVYIPTFILLDAFWRRPLNRTRAVLVGSILALVPRLLIAWRFEEAASATAWLLYWVQHLAYFPFAVLPFAIAGAVFGLLWCETSPPRLRRAV